MAVVPESTPCEAFEVHARVLQGIVFVQQLAAESADVWLRRMERAHAPEPARLVGQNVRIEEQQQGCARDRRSQVVRHRVAAVLAQDHYPEGNTEQPFSAGGA